MSRLAWGDYPVSPVNSRDVAELFKKHHKNVLRDIDDRRQEIGSDLSRSFWYRTAISVDAYGRDQPSVDLTRDGLVFLASRWTGGDATRFLLRYMDAFNAMEAVLKSEMPPIAEMIISGLREAVAPLAVRFDSQDSAIEGVKVEISGVKVQVNGIADEISVIKGWLRNRPRKISDITKREHIDALGLLFGGMCPCGCGRVVVENGVKSPFAEFDHFYANSKADAAHTWLIHKICHSDFTFGRRDRRDGLRRSS